MRRRRLANSTRCPDRRTFLFFLTQVDLKVPAAREDHVALSSIERVAAVDAMKSIRRPLAILIDKYFSRCVFKSHLHVVWKLANPFLQIDAAAVRCDLDWMRRL